MGGGRPRWSKGQWLDHITTRWSGTVACADAPGDSFCPCVSGSLTSTAICRVTLSWRSGRHRGLMLRCGARCLPALLEIVNCLVCPCGGTNNGIFLRSKRFSEVLGDVDAPHYSDSATSADTWGGGANPCLLFPDTPVAHALAVFPGHVA